MSHIFISYSHTDSEYARNLAESLTQRGFNVWIDERIDYGTQWPHIIQEHLDTCGALIVIMTPRSYNSEWVQSELSRAKRKKKLIFPLLLEGDEPWLSVESLQYVDVTKSTLPDARFYDRLAQIVPPNSPNEPSAISVPPQPDTAAYELPGLKWCNIPAGDVTIPYNQRSETFHVEAFRIGKFPITARQFQVFIDDSVGYRSWRWWGFSDHARHWHDRTPQSAPLTFLGDDLPRVNVSWYEAMTFCRWLSQQSGLEVTLPTEQQWQRAAQGNDNRLYPWGNTFETRRCNVGLGMGPTPVHSFPGGMSPYGVHDMAGNVWEWTLTNFDTGANDDLASQAQRVLRGGSWINDAQGVQTTIRAAGNSDNDTRGQTSAVGFRLVTSARTQE